VSVRVGGMAAGGSSKNPQQPSRFLFQLRLYRAHSFFKRSPQFQVENIDKK
jgi:hypothetical protein